jgi:DUF917 family protein
MWQVDADIVESIAIGAGILGTGGGGNPYNGKLRVFRQLQAGAVIQVVDPDEVPNDALCASVGGMGAPTIGIEKMGRGDESLTALRALEEHLGQRIAYLISGEIGGGNALAPMITAAQAGLSVIDGDGMGRAFPELQHCSYSIYGVRCTPAAVADVKHNTVVFADLQSTRTLESFARAVTVQMGGGSGYAFPVMTGTQVKETAVRRTITLAGRVGAAVRAAWATHRDPVEAVIAETGGCVLFRGKVSDVQRRMVAGFARGHLVLEGLDEDRGHRLDIDVQNEYLIARRDGETIAVVPDLICMVDLTTAAPITTEVVRYGLRAAVIGIPAPALMKSVRALDVVGPAAFGYADVVYRPLPGIYRGDELTAAETGAFEI